MKNWKRSLAVGGLGMMMLLTACGGSGAKEAEKPVDLSSISVEELEKKAKEEGEIQSIGMPDAWANWKDTWDQISEKYALNHTDTDMSSAEEIALFEQEKSNPTKDIGDVGQSFGPVAEEKGVSAKYKTSYWDKVPDWAKDDDGDWIIAYYGTIAIITNTTKVANPPKSFADVLEGDYKVSIGDVNAATQAQNALLSAAIANGGDEKNLQPGFDYFAKLAEQGRLDLSDPSVQRLEKGEVEVAFVWDFNGLNYAKQVEESNPNLKFEVTIPSDGAVQSGYSTIINARAPHPHAAALAREYILSDQGQINLAKGYARPIRDDVELPADVKDMLLDDSLYAKAQPIKDMKAWDEAAKGLGQKWQAEVLTKAKK